jgi:hypothetical protein
MFAFKIEKEILKISRKNRWQLLVPTEINPRDFVQQQSKLEKLQKSCKFEKESKMKWRCTT